MTRIGHGVRSADDPRLMAELARRGIVLEVCPGSNIALGLYADRAAHPLHRLIAAGVRVTLNSDDPPFFHTTLGTEYDKAGLGERELHGIARRARSVVVVEEHVAVRLGARVLLDARRPAAAARPGEQVGMGGLL